MRWARGNEGEAPARVALDRGQGWAPAPMPQRLFALERRLPVWLHPTYRGAVCTFGLGTSVTGKLYLLALLVTLMLMVGPRLGAVLFLGSLGVTIAAGAVGGTVHGILRPLDLLGRSGTWLRWLSAIFMALIASAVLTPHGPFTLHDPALYVLALAVAVPGAGLLLLLDDRRPGRPTPRRFQYLQERGRLWATADEARARRRPPLPPLAVAVACRAAAPRTAAWSHGLKAAAAAALSVLTLGH